MNTKKFISNLNYKGENTCGEAAGNFFKIHNYISIKIYVVF